VELTPGSPVPVSPARLKKLLHGHGIPREPGLAHLTVDAAHRAGLERVWVSIAVSRVEIAF
jgi:hypothetical protein